MYVSATPGKYEYEHCTKEDFAEQVIRPTGLLDPIISVRPSRAEFWNEHVHTIKKDEANNQIDDLCIEVETRIKKNQRVLVTTATKKMAEKIIRLFCRNWGKRQIFTFRSRKFRTNRNHSIITRRND